MEKTKKNSANKKIKNALKIFEWAIIIFLFGCMLWVLSQTITGHEPSLFGYKAYRVLTGSMSGTFEVGDVVISKDVEDPKTIEKGDIISFVAPEGFDAKNLLKGQIVTHRVVIAPYYDEDLKCWCVVTKGDAASSNDLRPIPLNNVRGKVIATSPFLSKLLDFLSKWYGFAIVVVLPLVSVLIWQIVILAKAGTEKERQRIENEKSKELNVENVKQQLEQDIKQKAIEEYIRNQK